MTAPSVSFEFFPPKSLEASFRLWDTVQALAPLDPAFVSVTYGAGGSTRARTHDLVVRLRSETSLLPMPHLTGRGHTKAEMESILVRFAESGVDNILALRGDPPKAGDPGPGDFPHAIDLVRFIKAFNESGGHPCLLYTSPSPRDRTRSRMPSSA